MTEKITLSGVPETMLQIVYACARESEGRGTIHDPKAEEIIRRLDCDFSLADSDTAMRSGVIARTLVLDRLARSWLAQHPALSLSTSEERRRGSEKYHERCLNKETYVCKRPNFCALAHSSGGRFRAAARFDSRAAQMEEFDGSRL